MTKTTIEEMLRMQFKRARKKGYADNFEFEERCDTYESLRSDERCVVKVKARDNTSFHITNQGIIHQGESSRNILDYNQLKEVYWMSEDFEGRKKLLKKYHDRIIMKTNDKKRKVIDNLGGSYRPLYASLYWYCNLKN